VSCTAQHGPKTTSNHHHPLTNFIPDTSYGHKRHAQSMDIHHYCITPLGLMMSMHLNPCKKPHRLTPSSQTPRLLLCNILNVGVQNEARTCSTTVRARWSFPTLGNFPSFHSFPSFPEGCESKTRNLNFSRLAGVAQRWKTFPGFPGVPSFPQRYSCFS
jgi:hypothetical protein